MEGLGSSNLKSLIESALHEKIDQEEEAVRVYKPESGPEPEIESEAEEEAYADDQEEPTTDTSPKKEISTEELKKILGPKP